MSTFNKNIVGYGIVDKSTNQFFNAYATGYIETISDTETGVTGEFYRGYYSDQKSEHIFSVDEYKIDYNRYFEFNSGTAKKVQNTVDEMIGFHKTILENNLLCARGLELMDNSSAVIPVALRQQLYNLQYRLSMRNDELKKSGYVENIQEGESPNFSRYNTSIIRFMQNPGIGFVISTTAFIIISCIIIAGTALTAWAIFKKMHTEAKADFSYSNNLTADLMKYLPPEVYKQLMEENAANEAKAQDAIDAAGGKSLINTLKYLAIGFGSIWAFNKITKNK